MFGFGQWRRRRILSKSDLDDATWRRVTERFSFVARLEEIAIEAKHAFLGAGGSEFHALPCLNESPEWIAALARITAERGTRNSP